MTATVSNIRGLARSMAWIATPSGSSIIASSADRFEGIGKSCRSATTMRCVSAPSNGGAPVNSTFGQRFGWARRQNSQAPQGLAGSMATRSPGWCLPESSATTRPANS